MSIGGESVNLLIIRTKEDPSIWEKQGGKYCLDAHGTWSVTLDLSGSLPELIFRGRVGENSSREFRVNDLTPTTDFIDPDEGKSRLWIATLANEVTQGAFSIEQSIEAINGVIQSDQAEID